MFNVNAYEPIDLTFVGQKQYNITACNRLWLPKKAVLQGSNGLAALSNPHDAVIAIRFNDPAGAPLVFGIADGLALVAVGRITEIFVTVLTQGTSNVLWLASGNGIGLVSGDADGLTAQVPAPTDGVSVAGRGE